MDSTNRAFLSKVASFTRVALDEISEKQAQVNDLEGQVLSFIRKDAILKRAELTKQAQLVLLLKEAADALYESDHITDESERKEFLKKAEDPTFLAKTLIKICKAADVSLIGSPARVAVTKTADYDPVAERAFGSRRRSIIDD